MNVTSIRTSAGSYWSSHNLIYVEKYPEILEALKNALELNKNSLDVYKYNLYDHRRDRVITIHLEE